MVEIKYDEKNGYLKLPKNIRQVGQSNQNAKIYVEDYVVTFLNRLAKVSPMEEKLAILLGFTEKENDIQYTFVDGAIAVDDVNIHEDHIGFTSGIWAKIYDDIKKSFGESKIIGWFLTRPGKKMTMSNEIIKIHENHFSGNGKVLFLLEPIDCEELFYVYHQDALISLNGYYVYYERNEAMHRYMMTYFDKMEEEKQFDQVLLEDFDGDDKKTKHTKWSSSLSKAVAALALFVVAGSVASVYQRQKIQEQYANAGLALQDESKIIFDDNIDTALEGSRSTDYTGTGGELIAESQMITKNESENMKEIVEEEKHPNDSNEETMSQTQPAWSMSVLHEPTALNGMQYTVMEGDTLAEISMKFYDTFEYVSDICNLNHIDDADKVYTGMILTLP